MPDGGITNEELFKRLGVFYSEAQVALIANEMEDASSVRTRGEFELPPVDDEGVPLTLGQELAVAKQQAARRLDEIRNRYTRRMHDLSEFMKSLLERFTKWFNRTHSRSGTLWAIIYLSPCNEHMPQLIQMLSCFKRIPLPKL